MSATRTTFIPTHSDLFTKVVENKTLHAWDPFQDCVGMNFVLQNSDLDEEHPEWRMHWVFGVTMLRTVGHVLAKIDARSSARHRRAIDQSWKNWKAHREDNWIFWDFVENERNNILKAYKFGVDLTEEGLWHSTLDHDGIQLLREATYWWRRQLLDIESQITL
jgi:hypothetical protein